MITENITKEFIDKHYFVLDKPYYVEEYDADGFSTGRYMDIKSGTEWQITDESFIGGEVHLEGLSDECCGWLEISREVFEEYFSAHEWKRRNR